jgi:hypothetical protein
MGLLLFDCGHTPSSKERVSRLSYWHVLLLNGVTEWSRSLPGVLHTKGESNFEILKATIEALMERKSDPDIASLRVTISQCPAVKAFVH